MCLRDLFRQVAKGDIGYLQAIEGISKSRSGDKALVWNDGSWTYNEFFARVDKMAAHLQANDIGPNDIIGVYADRSPEMMVSILGILKAGAAFLPLDPQYPEDRIRFMVVDTWTPIYFAPTAIGKISTPQTLIMSYLMLEWRIWLISFTPPVQQALQKELWSLLGTYSATR